MIDLSTFPSKKVHIGIHFKSGSGFLNHIINMYQDKGIDVQLFAKIIHHQETMPQLIKQKYTMYQEIYNKFIGSKVSQQDRTKGNGFNKQEFTYGEIVFTSFVPILEFACAEVEPD